MNKFYKISIVIFSIIISWNAVGQQVSPDTMQLVYDEVKTPHKYGIVLAPESDDKKIDCPTIFRKGGKWYMSYIIFDGRGYETWLATSKNLLDWTTLGRILSFSDTTKWDGNQKAGYIALQDTKWGGSYKIKKFKGKNWISYFGGPTAGYEAGELSIGMAYTNQRIDQPHEWQRLPDPVLSPRDTDVRWWDNKKIFKSTVIADKSKKTGYPFVMYYNANGDTTGDKQLRWFERIGMAGSHDMQNWHRMGNDPVLAHSRGITGDAILQQIGKVWVMFYFGAFWQGREQQAFNRFACSYDLVNWTDWTGDDLVNSSEPYDEKYAHKSFVIKHKGVVYHYYNAVNQKDQRGIAVATSVPMGKSNLHFKK